jgi:hypothetical protein
MKIFSKFKGGFTGLEEHLPLIPAEKIFAEKLRFHSFP